MSKSTYSEKLKDPRWQKKRLEIFNRDNFTCRFCGETEETLNVHHLNYANEPWDVPNDQLLTLCENCHEAEHMFRNEAEKGLLKQLKLKGFDHTDIATLEYAFYNLNLQNKKGEVLRVLSWAMRTSEVISS